jgi:hypothetical protein
MTITSHVSGAITPLTTSYDVVLSGYVSPLLGNLRRTCGWWYTYPSEKYEFVSWDDYSQYMEK